MTGSVGQSTRRSGIAVAIGGALVLIISVLPGGTQPAVGQDGGQAPPGARDIGDACAGAGANAEAFTDSDQLTTEETRALDCLSAQGWGPMVQGFGDGSYGPREDVDRAQMAAFIARKLEAVGFAPDGDAPDAFDDDTPGTSGGATAAQHGAINWLADLGIVSGRPDSADADGDGETSELLYHARERVRRDQMGSFINRQVGYVVNGDAGQGLTSEDDYFTDSCDGVHEPNVDALADHGIVQGTTSASGQPTGRFECDEAVTRGQMLNFLGRDLDLIVQGGFGDSPFFDAGSQVRAGEDLRGAFDAVDPGASVSLDGDCVDSQQLSDDDASADGFQFSAPVHADFEGECTITITIDYAAGTSTSTVVTQQQRDTATVDEDDSDRDTLQKHYTFTVMAADGDGAPANLILEPQTDTNTIADAGGPGEHTVGAAITDSGGAPVEQVTVVFELYRDGAGDGTGIDEVYSGPDQVVTRTTAADGTASWTYDGPQDAAEQDYVVACAYTQDASPDTSANTSPCDVADENGGAGTGDAAAIDDADGDTGPEFTTDANSPRDQARKYWRDPGAAGCPCHVVTDITLAQDGAATEVTNTVDDTHWVTATVTDTQGPRAGAQVLFEFDDGRTGTYAQGRDVTTDGSGESTVSYSRSNARYEAYRACTNHDGSLPSNCDSADFVSNVLYKVWTPYVVSAEVRDHNLLEVTFNEPFNCGKSDPEEFLYTDAQGTSTQANSGACAAGDPTDSVGLPAGTIDNEETGTVTYPAGASSYEDADTGIPVQAPLTVHVPAGDTSPLSTDITVIQGEGNAGWSTEDQIRFTFDQRMLPQVDGETIQISVSGIGNYCTITQGTDTDMWAWSDDDTVLTISPDDDNPGEDCSSNQAYDDDPEREGEDPTMIAFDSSLLDADFGGQGWDVDAIRGSPDITVSGWWEEFSSP